MPIMRPWGLDGLRAYKDTVEYLRAQGLPVIADVKRGDIAKTAEMYARAHFTGELEVDWMTLAPYMGLDSIEPYAQYMRENGKGVFVLCRTSNPGAKDFEYEVLADGRHVYDMVGDKLNAMGKAFLGESGYSSLGLVIGGTHIEEARQIRARYRDSFFLIPGYGAQGRYRAGHCAVPQRGQRRCGELQPRCAAGIQKAAGRAVCRGGVQRVRKNEGGHCPCLRRALRPACWWQASRQRIFSFSPYTFRRSAKKPKSGPVLHAARLGGRRAAAARAPHQRTPL